MKTKAAHKIFKTKAVDDKNREYHCYVCNNCQYIVVAYPQLTQESHHEPSYRMILLRQKDLTEADCRKFFKKYDVENCPEAGGQFTDRVVDASTSLRVSK